MLLKDADEEGRRELTALIMTPPEARLTGDEELDEMPIPSWWHGEEEAAVEGQRAAAWYSNIKPVEVD